MDHGIRTSWIVTSSLLASVAVMWGCSFAPDINKVGGYVLVFELDETNHIDESSVVDVVERRLSGRRGIQVRLIDRNKLEVTVPGLNAKDLQAVQDLVSTDDPIGDMRPSTDYRTILYRTILRAGCGVFDFDITSRPASLQSE